jgi:hypothetical protein
MPMWIMVCKRCGVEFQHSQININDVGMFLYYVARPEVPADGHKCVCPKCGHEDLYRRTDLLYRA